MCFSSESAEPTQLEVPATEGKKGSLVVKTWSAKDKGLIVVLKHFTWNHVVVLFFSFWVKCSLCPEALYLEMTYGFFSSIFPKWLLMNSEIVEWLLYNLDSASVGALYA